MPTLIQSKFGVTGGTSIAVAFTSNTTTGNTILAFGTANSAGTQLNFSDGNGAYTRDSTQNSGSSQLACGHSAVIASGGPTTVTMTSVANVTIGLTIQEWAGLNSSPFDQVTTIATGTGTTATANASGTLGASGGVFVAWTNSSASVTWTAGTGFGIDPASSNPSSRVVEYQVTGSTSPITATLTMSGSVTWSILAASYLPAPVVGPVLPVVSRKYFLFYT